MPKKKVVKNKGAYNRIVKGKPQIVKPHPQSYHKGSNAKPDLKPFFIKHGETDSHLGIDAELRHNIILEKGERKRCPNCGARIDTIARPYNDLYYSNKSAYMIVCPECRRSWFLIHTNYQKSEDNMIDPKNPLATSHNIRLSGRSRKKCPNCGRVAETVSQPNNQLRHSRNASYMTVCKKCQNAFLLYYVDNNKAKKSLADVKKVRDRLLG